MSTSNNPQKKHSWSFGFKHPKKNIKQAVQQFVQPMSLPKQFFVQLIKLEADFNNKVYTLDTLNQLTQYYAKAVEHYDNLKDEISSYFILKIQDILATRQSLTMLSEHRQKLEESENKPVQQTNEPPTESDLNEGEGFKPSLGEDNIIEENSDDEEDIEIDHLEQKRKAAKRHRDNRASISQIRNEKQRFVHFFYKMENEKRNEKQNMHNVLDEFTNSRMKNDSCILNNLDNQRERLRNRLEQRRIESFQSQTMSVTSYRNPLNLSNSAEKRRKNGQTLELVLKELDDGDEVEFGMSLSDAEDNFHQGLSVHEEDEPHPLADTEIKNVLRPKNLNFTESEENHKLNLERSEQKKLTDIQKQDTENIMNRLNLKSENLKKGTDFESVENNQT